MHQERTLKRGELFQELCRFLGLAVLVLGVPVFLLLLSFAPNQNADRWQTFFQGLQAFGTLLTVGAIVAAFDQVRAAKKQLSDARKWNKMSSALSFLPSVDQLSEWDQELEKEVKFVSRSNPLTDDELKAIYAKPEVELKLKNYLNVLEKYALAINIELVDERVAKRAFKTKMISHFREMKPFIQHLRAVRNAPTAFSELEKVCSRWEAPDTDVEAYGRGDW